MKIRPTQTTSSTTVPIKFMRQWIISWTCPASMPLHFLCLSSRRLFWLSCKVNFIPAFLSWFKCYHFKDKPFLSFYLKWFPNLRYVWSNLILSWDISQYKIISLIYCLVPFPLTYKFYRTIGHSVLFIACTEIGKSHIREALKMLPPLSFFSYHFT